MKVRFLDVADQEYRNAYDYYETVVEHLGEDFKEAVVAALARIQTYPGAWQKVTVRSRRCRLERFPYGIVYQKRENEILVVAVMHMHRSPHYWGSTLEIMSKLATSH